MDVIAKLQERDIPKIVVPTLNAFAPLLEPKREQISSVPKTTYQYGRTERHKLDVYYPTSSSTLAGSPQKTPVLFFIYGGGFTTGQRSFPPPFDLAYGNLAAYFAQRGIITVIPDYRLAPDVVFPAPAEDVRDAITWIVNHPDNLVSPTSPSPDLSAMSVLAQSAGAAHMATALLLPNIKLRPQLRQVFLLGGAYSFEGKVTGLENVLLQYWGSEDGIKDNAPLGLLKRASAEVMKGFPEVVMLNSEKDPQRMLDAAKTFQVMLEKRTERRVDHITALGHNHISPTWALGTGTGEEWAEEVAKRIIRYLVV